MSPISNHLNWRHFSTSSQVYIILFSFTVTERANIKQLTVNGGYSKLRGRICTVILTSTHQWNLWVQGGQLLRMSVPLSIFIPNPSTTSHALSPFYFICTPLMPRFDVCSRAVQWQLKFLWHTDGICFTSVTVTPYKAQFFSLLLSLMYLSHVRRPVWLWGSESTILLKIQTALGLHYHPKLLMIYQLYIWYHLPIRDFTRGQTTFHNRYPQQPWRHDFLVAFLIIYMKFTLLNIKTVVLINASAPWKRKR